MQTVGFLLVSACLLFCPFWSEGQAEAPPIVLGIDGAPAENALPAVRPLSPSSGQAPGAPYVGAFLQYTLPVTPTNLLLDDTGIWFSSFNQGAVGHLDPAAGASLVYDLSHRGSVFEIKKDDSGRIWYSTASGEGGNDTVGMLVQPTGLATEWVVPRNHFGLHVSPVGDEVWFVSKGLPEAQLVRLDPDINQATLWNISPYTDTYDLEIAPGGAIWFTVQPRGLQGVGRLDAVTGQASIWTMPFPASRPFRILAAGADEIWFTEFGTPGSAISRLTPSTGQLEEYPVPSSANAPAAMIKLADQVWFTSYDGRSIGHLDLNAATPTVAQLTATSIAATSTSQLLSRSSFMPSVAKAAAPVTSFVTNGGAYGAYIIFPVPGPDSKPFDIATADAGQTFWFTDGGAPRIMRLAPGLRPYLFLPFLNRSN